MRKQKTEGTQPIDNVENKLRNALVGLLRKMGLKVSTDSQWAQSVMVLAHYSGRRGAERLREAEREIARSKGTTLESVRALSAIKKVKDALQRFWKGVADMLGIHFTTAEDVADKVLSDLLNGVNPNDFANPNDKARMQFVGEKGAEKKKNPTWEEITDALDNTPASRTNVPDFNMKSSKSDCTKVRNNDVVAKELEELSESFNNNYAFSAKEFIGQIALRFIVCSQNTQLSVQADNNTALDAEKV